jgi:hypothetical protein
MPQQRWKKSDSLCLLASLGPPHRLPDKKQKVHAIEWTGFKRQDFDLTIAWAD